MPTRDRGFEWQQATGLQPSLPDTTPRPGGQALTDHALRTALTVILGHAELLLDGAYGPLNERQLEPLTVIHQAVEALTEALPGTCVADWSAGGGCGTGDDRS